MKDSGGVLFATDFSMASSSAFREAMRQASGRNVPLLVAHVLHLPLPLSPEGLPVPRTADDLAAAARREAGKSLKTLLAKARRARVRATGLLLTGRADQAVARAARKHDVDLVVVGTHARKGLPRLLLGSVAARIIASAPCPVLAVPRRYAFRRRTMTGTSRFWPAVRSEAIDRRSRGGQRRTS